MSSASDYIIENGVLKQYVGPGGDVVIPHGVTSIGEGAFCECRSLTSVVIPDGATSIGKEAFEGCSSLTSVTIPDGVTSIGFGTFKGCRSLTDVTIPEGVTSIGFGAFCECRSLTSVMIPKDVTIIEKEAFEGCRGLTSVVIPDGVTSIGDSAFRECSSLTSVKIPDSVTSIGDEAFYECSKLKSATIPDGVTSIGKEAFSHCSKLKSVTIPGSVTSIGDGAFYECSKLKSLEIYSSIKLTKDIFNRVKPERVTTVDPGNLPVAWRPIAAVGYAENPAEPGSEREKKHLKFFKSNATKLMKVALAHPALLGLMCEKKLLTPEVTEAYLAAAQEAGNAEAITVLLDYQQNKLSAQEKEKAAQKVEAREEKVTDFVFSAEALEKLQGKVFVVTGALKSFTRTEFKACLDACGAILSETLNEQTDYLITNTPDSGSAKNKKAEQLGVKKLSEEEFNRLIGRKQY